MSSSSAASTIRLFLALIAAMCLAIVPAAAGAAAPKAKKTAPKRTYVFCVVAKAAKAKPKKVAKPKKIKARSASLRVNRAAARRIARLRLAGHRVIVKRCAPAAKKKGSTTASTTTKTASAKTPSKGAGKGSGKGGSSTTTTATAADDTVAAKPVVAPKPAPAASGSGLNLGLVADTQGWGAQMGARMDAATATGVRWLREEFSWSAIEPNDNQWSWSRYDQLMTESSKRGVHIVALAMTTPGWAGATWDTISDDPTQYAQFIAAIAGRYGPGGTFWADHPALTAVPLEQIELLNEPFLPQFAAGDTNAARYARLVRAATSAGRAANPGVQFLMAMDTTSYDSAQNQHEWIDALYSEVPDLNSYYDGITVHPYGSLDKYTSGASRWQFRRIEDIRAKLVDHDAADKGFWLTEIGWPTCAQGCETEAQQADFVGRSIDMMRTTYADYVRAAFFYRYDDLGHSNGPTDREAAYGLKHADGSPKPAWDVLASKLAG